MTSATSGDTSYDTAVAIIGMAGRFPGAQTVEAFWRNIATGVRSIRSYSDEELLAAGVDPQLLRQPNYVKAGTQIADIDLFDAAFFGYPPREAEIMDPQHRLFLECAWEALEHAAYNPESYQGQIGVFAGSPFSSYLIHNIATNPEVAELMGDVQIDIGNNIDALASTVSYKLNLRGPSVGVQSFCSTSMVAVHLASQSLLTYECDLALAGGVVIMVPHCTGYFYQEGGILSPDGHVRTFDAKAQGSVMSNGMGLVVLKRMEDALADGDTIYAVIRGSAITNDGIRKVGYTAPGLGGQSSVIARALRRAGVKPETISYMETHGTGTPLGDSVELSAMIRAFQRGTQKQQFCAIGSVKPNIGHLDRASGIAGLIKTVMALKNKQLPPHIDFESSNPEIDLANSPFYVNTQLRDWPANGEPRRAGVSSFGLGGTNAHAIVEEPPPPAPTSPARPYHLLLLSAKTEAALDAATANLATHLRAQPDLPLAEVAYTLQVGRAAFAQRRLLVARDRDEAIALLESRDPRRVFSASVANRDRPVAFLFPGVGDHYVGMAQELYASEPTFRETVDRCCALLQPLLSQDLRALLYPDQGPTTNDQGPTSSDAGALDLRALLGRAGHDGRGAAGPLQQTALAQPAVFVVEYALAQLLTQWGVRPAALLGYSLGEYVAACLAGVLSLEDALRLVARRAQLIQALPAGAMLAVGLSEAAVQPWLGEGVELAVINSPSTCVLAGPLDVIATLEQRLAAAEVVCRRVETSHAFHTSMLAPVAEELTALARTVTLNPPQTPYLSNVTGTWITAEQATDPAYWAQHMCQTVRFAEGIGVLLQQAQQALLEVGPGAALGSFVRQHPACSRERMGLVLATLPGAQERTSDRAAVLTTLGKLWEIGVTIDWAGFYAGERRQRVALPSYPFERQRYWIEPGGASARPALTGLVDAGKKADIADWFYTPTWQPCPLETPAAARPAPWLLFMDERGLGATLAALLTQMGHTVVQIQCGAAFAQHSAEAFTLRADQPADYQELIAALRDSGRFPRRIVHLWSLDAASVSADPQGFRASQMRGYHSLLCLTKALGQQLIDERIELVIATDGMQAVGADEIPVAEQATIAGLRAVISQENVTITSRSVDLRLADAPATLETAAAQLLAESCAGTSDLAVAYRDEIRLVQRYTPLRLERPAGESRLRTRGVYLITGGMGEVGLLLAGYLARTVQARLTLLGRTGLPPREGWDDWLATNPETDPTSRRILKVQALEAQGAEVLVLGADVADAGQLGAAVARTIAHFGALHGVLHAAGNSDPQSYALIQEIEATQSELHFQPKVHGLYALEAALGAHELDFCLVFSSISALLGGLGFAGYASANRFMDAFVQRHNRTHPTAWVAINWDTWRLKEDQYDVLGATLAQYEMLPAEGAEAFERAIFARGHDQIVNSTGDLDARIRQWVQLESLRGDDEAEAESDQPRTRADKALTSGEYERRITAIWQQVLGIAQVGLHDNFFDLGGNSLIGLQVIAKLKKEFKIQVPAVALFEAPTVSALAQYLMPEPEPVADQQAAQLADRRQRARQVTEHQDIAIIAMVGRFPGAENVEQFWQNLRDGVEGLTYFSNDELVASGIDLLLLQNPNYIKARPVLSDVEHFDAAFFGYTPREAEFLDPQQRLFHECAWEALEQAGYDTQRYKGLVGVFGGTNQNSYLMRLVIDPDYRSQITDMTGLENDKDALTTNVSYKLNLRGPSFAVQTYCSTSLVATHLACRSLRGGECDMALAGGVSVRVPVKSGYFYQDGDQVSADGHVRTFDAQATGATFGDGVAVVVLKRLADALEDGDTIHAVIKGSAINNDGGLKVGYTAPSVVGQADVVVAALQDAGLSAEAISYVEAHGTATKLGDPIEVASLTKAFRTMTDKTGYCMLSSVKPNVGHLDRAAGATALIKTVMALKHDLIPPHLHFQTPNPEIDFASSPFYVPVQATPWKRNGTPRRAGVNSLGVGGTNAHVVVEEAPPIPPPSPARPYHLLLLSARTPTALEAATDQLLAYLRDQPDAPLAEVAYTLQVGRRVFDQRQLLVVRDRTEALDMLERRDPRRLISQTQKPTSRAVAFLFPGVGDHYVGMAEELYASEPTFHAAIDRCCRILQPLLDKDLRALLYPEDGAATNDQQPTSTDAGSLNLRALMGRNGQDGRGAAGPLQQTVLAQPAVFVVEYALAQLLMQWGVRPAALLGYSLGEYVAACLAGVLSLDDALRLVALRARLIQNLPAGAMLAVGLPEEQIQPYLGAGVELAVINSPHACVLAGPPAAIAVLEQRLAAAEVACRRVETSHAFHTSMLAPVAEELTALARTVTLHPPQIPYLSNVTGTWITEEQATDPAYWAQHMCQTVRFAEGVGTLLAAEEQLLLEVGPGAALGSFVRQHPACSRERMGLVLATLPGVQERGSDRAAALTTLGKLWLLDVPIDWDGFYAGERRLRIPLPTYPFERQRFWLEPNLQRSGTARNMFVRRPDVTDWFSVTSWKRSVPIRAAHAAQQLAERQRWLLFADECGVGAGLGEWLTAQGQEVITVTPGAAFARLGAGRYTVRPAERADYDTLLQQLKDPPVCRIVHLWMVTHPIPEQDDLATVAPLLDRGFYSLLALSQALGDLGVEFCRIDVVSNDMQEVTATEQLCPAKATVIGPCRSILQEYANLAAHSIDLALPAGAPNAMLIQQLGRELTAGTEDDFVALRGPQRWVQTYEPIQIPDTGATPRLRERGVYLIVGGLGGIGLAIAEHLADTVQARLVLLGRTALPPRYAWPDILAAQGVEDSVGRRIRQVQALEARGAEVLLLHADVADPDQVKAAVEQALARFGTINGVFHTAGVPGVGLMQLKTAEAAAGVLAPKVQGTLALGAALRQVELDFLVLFSSITSATGGGPGQADYCAANAFLDAYARRHFHEHGMTVAVGWGEWQWDAWSAGLMGFPEEIRAQLIAIRRAFGIHFHEGMQVLRRVLANELPHLFVTSQDLLAMVESSKSHSAAAVFRQLEEQLQAHPLHPRPVLGTSYIAPENEQEEQIAAIWGGVLGIDEIGTNDNFFELGGNSLIGIQIIARLRQTFQVNAPLTLLFEAPTVNEMAIAIEMMIIDKLEKMDEEEEPSLA